MKKMIKKPYHALLSAALLASAMTSMASANANGVSSVVPASDAAVNGTKFTYSCSNGNFKGEIELEYAFQVKGGSKMFNVSPQKYRITRYNGQHGGNKANVSFQAGIQDAGGYKYDGVTQHSPDSMQQDGKWHDLNMNAVSIATDSGGKGWTNIEFVFDKSGKDPQCSEMMWYYR